MKRNLILFFTLILLIVLTYFFQEKKTQQDFLRSQSEGRVITEEITHLKLPQLEAEKKKGSWWQGNILLSHNLMKQIEKKLTEIKKVKNVDGEWSAYFSHPLKIQINKEDWTIGDMSLDRQAFYLARGNEIMLAVIEGENAQLTHDENELASIKLNELVSLISRPLNEFTETQLFRFYPNLPLDRAVVTSDGSLPFELNFLTNQTLPLPIDGVAVHKDLRGKFYSLLSQVLIRKEVTYSEKLKFKKMAQIDFISEQESRQWELWLAGKDSADSYVVDPQSKRAFLMSGGTLKIFFIQLQDYWDKKVIPSKNFKNFTRLDAVFTQGTKQAKVIIINREPFKFETKGFKVQEFPMENLIQFIFNLGPKDQASRVSKLTASERKQVLSEDFLKVEVFDQELILWPKEHELIVVNLTQGFKAHFVLSGEKIHASFNDVLK